MSVASRARSIFCSLLARQQKVDLAKISILALADQYLAFVEQARRTRLELAADYLVMAAWLAYLKSRMLLPEPAAPEGMSAADLAKALALRLQRLEAIREAGTKLFERALLGRDVFGARRSAADRRNQAAGMVGHALRPSLGLCVRAAAQRARPRPPRQAHGMVACRCPRHAGTPGRHDSGEWSRLDEYPLAYAVEPAMRATALASSLAATLELVREGTMEVHQSAAFAPIYLRKRMAGGGDGAVAAP